MARHEEIAGLLSDIEIINDQDRFRNLSMEYAQLEALVGGGDRSERIRTYNYPQGRLTDHRINLTLYKLDEIMQGGLRQVVDPLMHEFQAEQLASLSGDDRGLN